MDTNTNQIFTDFFSSILGFPPELTINEEESQIDIQLQLEPTHSGALIGYQGETLNAIQLLLSLIYQKHHQEWKPVRLNINDYRQKRQQSIENLSDNLASKAIAENQPVSLINLSSYERRLVHFHLSDNPEVSTHSEGEEPNRVLVISPNPTSSKE